MHFQVDVAGLLAADTRFLRRAMGALRVEGRKPKTIHEMRSALAGLLSKGVKYLPIGQPCEGWTDAEGCPGHDIEEVNP